MINWIVWKWTVFDIETVLILNWIVWNRTDYLHKNGFSVKYKGWYAIKPQPTNR